MFNQYPYINLNDLNLDYILKAIKEMRYEVTNFVSINAIKYADPIQWNITSQYEKNTIVIDPQTGTAYISVAPVPTGVALTRPEYWTVVFDLGSFVTRAAQNFTDHWESETTLTATFPTAAGGWLVWGDTLYVANVNITAGDSYVVGGNITHITVEEVKNTIMQLIADNYDVIVAMIGDLDDLTTTAKNNIVAAINELVSGLSDEVQARQDADDAINTTIGDLDDLTTSDKTSIVDAINAEVQARQDADDAINTTIGDLDDLATSDKTSVVNAINEVKGEMGAFTAKTDIILFGDSWADYTHDPNNVRIHSVLADHFGMTVHNYAYGGTGFDVPNGYDEQITLMAADNIDYTKVKCAILVCGLNDYQRTTTKEQFTAMLKDWYNKLVAEIGDTIPIYWFNNYSIENNLTLTNPTTFYQQFAYYEHVRQNVDAPIIMPTTFGWIEEWNNDTHPNATGSTSYAMNMCRAIEGIEPTLYKYQAITLNLGTNGITIDYYYNGTEKLDIYWKAYLVDMVTITTVVQLAYNHTPPARLVDGCYLGEGHCLGSSDYSAISMAVNNLSFIQGTTYTSHGKLYVPLEMA